MTRPFTTKTKRRRPGEMRNDALVMFAGRPLAGLRDAEMTHGIMYGLPIWRDVDARERFVDAFTEGRTVELEIRHPVYGELSGEFRIVECDDMMIGLRQL